MTVGRASFHEFDGRSYNAIYPPPPEFLWARLGVNGEYEKFDDIVDVADHLFEFNVYSVEVADQYSVESSGFQGHDNISLFYGDNDAQPIRGLTSDEIEELNEVLEIRDRSQYGP